MERMVDVYIVGSKGIPAKYGGFETFVEELTKGKKSPNIQYHVSCMNADEKHFSHNSADCFNVKVPLPGPLGRIFHVSRALSSIERDYNPKNENIVYVLGCRIGPLMKRHYRNLKRKGFKVFVNPDGLEWKRDKWNSLQKRFLKYCEKCLVTHSDLSICDNKGIEKYINKKYPKAKTDYVAYGAYLKESSYDSSLFFDWLESHSISKAGYYLIVGRFVPENNYETMIREFMLSKTKRDLVIVTNVEKNKFFKRLLKETKFDSDSRIKIVGPIYDRELLLKVRENAYGYVHGHEVGGTNPSLLESLGSTNLNLLLNVDFNREVGGSSALYWKKESLSLATLINQAEGLSKKQIAQFGEMAKNRVRELYNWPFIVDEYEKIFLGDGI